MSASKKGSVRMPKMGLLAAQDNDRFHYTPDPALALSRRELDAIVRSTECGHVMAELLSSSLNTADPACVEVLNDRQQAAFVEAMWLSLNHIEGIVDGVRRRAEVRRN